MTSAGTRKVNPYASLPDFLQPRLRLFLSADLVGSTKLKQTDRFPLAEPTETDLAKFHAQWLSPILNFFEQMETHFASELRSFENNYKLLIHKSPFKNDIELWKMNGDEAIFSVELDQPQEATFYIHCWLQALTKVRRVIQDLRGPSKKEPSKTDDSLGLDIKGAAWTAGFPISNSEVVFTTKTTSNNKIKLEGSSPDPFESYFSLLEKWYKNKNKKPADLVRDFLGPSMDTGFRISAQASRGKLLLCPSVALLIASNDFPDKLKKEKVIDSNGLEVLYDGRRSLKGVLQESGYPIFWLIIPPADKLVEVERTSFRRDNDSIKEFCNTFFNVHSNVLYRPFLVNSGHDDFVTAPDHYNQYLNAMVKALENDRQISKMQSKAGISAGSAPPAQQVEKALSSIKNRVTGSRSEASVRPRKAKTTIVRMGAAGKAKKAK